MFYKKPKVRSLMYSPLALSQYAPQFTSFSGAVPTLPGSSECAVQNRGQLFATCFEGDIDLSNFKIVVRQNGALSEELLISGNCTVSSPGTGTECQASDTFLLCNGSLAFNSQDTYTLQLLNSNSSIIDTSQECPAT